ncbi:MAG: PAS domain S-box protein [Smithella sp.]
MADNKSLDNFDSFHNKLLGLGRKSLRKSYYPELQKRIEELENVQEELNKYKDHLEELVTKRTDELQRINEQLQREITERKQAEEGLRQSESVLGSVFRTTPVGLSILKDRVFQRVNKAWVEICGYSQFDIIGHTARLLYEEEEEYERVGRELFTDLAQRGLTFVQTKHRQKDGDIRDVVLTASPLYLDDIFSGMALVVIEDVTDRRQAEAALRESEVKFKSFAEQALVGTYLLQDGIFQYVNPKFANMFGYTVEECLSNMSFEILVHPDELDDVK